MASSRGKPAYAAIMLALTLVMDDAAADAPAEPGTEREGAGDAVDDEASSDP